MTTVTDTGRLLRPLRRRHQRRPVPHLRPPPRGGARLLQRALRLLGAVAPRRRREGAGQLAGVLEHPQRHPRHHQGRRRRCRPGVILFEDPPVAHHAPGPHVPGLHPAAHGRARGPGPRLLRPAASTRSSGPTASTSSPSSPSMLPMRVIGMLLGIPEEDQVAVRDKTDANLRTVPGQPMKVRAGERRQRRHVRRLHRVARRAPLRRPHDPAAQRRVRGRDTARPRTLDPPGGAHLHRRARRRRQRDDRPAHRLARQAPRRAPRPAAPGRRGPLAHPAT